MPNKPKSTRGGVRPGAGAKSQSPTGEVKKRYTIRLYPSDLEKIKQIHGSLQKAVGSLI